MKQNRLESLIEFYHSDIYIDIDIAERLLTHLLTLCRKANMNKGGKQANRGQTVSCKCYDDCAKLLLQMLEKQPMSKTFLESSSLTRGKNISSYKK